MKTWLLIVAALIGVFWFGSMVQDAADMFISRTIQYAVVVGTVIYMAFDR
jgi:hypothetical protein